MQALEAPFVNEVRTFLLFFSSDRWSLFTTLKAFFTIYWEINHENQVSTKLLVVLRAATAVLPRESIAVWIVYVRILKMEVGDAVF